MSNQILKKSYLAGTVPITPNSFVIFDAASGNVKLAGLSDVGVIGVTDPFCNPVLGDRLDVMHYGIADVVAGGAIARGQAVGSDAAGHAVVWAAGRKCGIALESAAAGDIIPVLLTLNF